MRHTRLVAALALGVGLTTVPPAEAKLRVPTGYSASRSDLADGVTHLRLSGNGQKINVAYLAPGARAAVRAVVAGPDRIASSRKQMETTSAMCRRVDCLLAVNGDFHLGGQPVGGIVRDGAMLRSPQPGRAEVWVEPNGRLGAGALSWAGSVSARDVGQIKLSAVNRKAGSNQTVLFTPAWGSSSTGTKKGTVEIVARILDSPVGRLGSPVRLELLKLTDKGSAKTDDDVVVLSGTGSHGKRLRELWDRRGSFAGVASLSLETFGRVADSLGANSVILLDRRNIAPRKGGFYTGSEPRTAIGWNRSTGEVWLVAVDGRQKGSKGVSLAWVADLLGDLGATDAASLDGGGGTAFVKQGTLVNNPSDGGSSGSKGKERPGPNAWMFIAT